MPPKRNFNQVYTKEELEAFSYLDLQKIAKNNEVKANGKKDEILERLVEFFKNGSTTTTTTTTTTTKVTGKRSKRDEDEEDENTEDEKVDLKPIPKRSTKKAAANKKQIVEKEDEENEEDENTDEEDKPKAVTAKTTGKTTTATIASSSGADKLVGPFEQNDYDTKKWIRDGSITFYIGEEINRPKIAAFDMDDTLIRTKTGKTFAVDCNDWVWWNQVVPENLRKLYKDGYQVIIVTNQGGIKHGAQFDQSKWNSITKKICILEKELDFPLIAIAACADDENRKPNNKMWLKLREFTDGKVIINESESFYCGDAAGRPENWKNGHKADFSSSDYGFALSSGIRFETPETHFLGEEHYKNSDGGDAVSSLIPKAETSGKAFDGDSITSKDFEVVVNVGFPASGKSTFSKKYFASAGYEVVNQDTLKTKDACIKAAKAALSKGKSVIIDNTNPTVQVRSEYIKLAKEFNAKVRCLHFQTPRDLAEHLNYYRERTQNIKHVPSMVYNIFNKNFVEPTTKEGFSSVTPIKFILDLKPSDLQQYNIPNPKAGKGKGKAKK